MSLDKRLKKVKAIGDEKKITLRMPEGKAILLDKLAKHYGTNTSTLIREMIDDAILKLELELIVLGDDYAIDFVKKNNQVKKVRYLPAMVELLAPDLTLYTYSSEDFCFNNDAYDNFRTEHSRLSKEYGLLLTDDEVKELK